MFTSICGKYPIATGGKPKETTPETPEGDCMFEEAGGITTPWNSRMRGRTNSTNVPMKSYILSPLRSTLTPHGIPGRIHDETAFLPRTTWTPSLVCRPPPPGVSPDKALKAPINPSKLLLVVIDSFMNECSCILSSFTILSVELGGACFFPTCEPPTGGLCRFLTYGSSGSYFRRICRGAGRGPCS